MAGKRARLAFSCMLMVLALAMCLLGTSCVADLPPSVDIVSPEDDATVAGIVSIEVHATDDYGIGAVRCRIDGESVPIELVSGDELDGFWQGNWDSTAVDDRFYTITVTATDTIGQRGVDSVIVLVDNVPPAPGSAEVQLRARVIRCFPPHCR